MGFLTDIAEIAGLLFVTYVVGWFVGYLAHRLTARTGRLETAIATQAVPSAPEPAADALVKAPVVVQVATTPPPVLAVASALEPVRATAVPDTSGEMPPSEPALMPATSPVVSALDTLKSLSTAMPLMPAGVQAPSTQAPVAGQIVVAPDTTPSAPAGSDGIAAAAQTAASAQFGEPTPASISPEPIAAATEPAAVPATEIVASVAVSPPAVVTAETTSAATPEVPGATDHPEVAVTPLEAPEPPPAAIEVAPAPPPMPASAPGMPWAGSINGHEAQKFAPDAVVGAISPPPLDEAIEEPDAALDVALLSSIADRLKLDQPEALVDGGLPVADAPPAPQPPIPPVADAPALEAAVPAQPQIAPRAAPAAEQPRPSEPEAPTLSPPAVAVPPPAPPRRPTLDEDAAMRAIEGGWSRRDVRALGDTPELTDVTAAVSAAQVAVEQVLARNGVDAAEPDSRAQAAFGKPIGLRQPRDGRRDSLRRIDGLGPLDEVTLNNLGIYHFDQIAKWSEREVLWLENHAFAVGRIGREGWQDQARELLAERDATRALR